MKLEIMALPMDEEDVMRPPESSSDEDIAPPPKLPREEAAMDAELHVLRLKDDIPIVEPDVRALDRRCIIPIYTRSLDGPVGLHVG